MVRAVMRLSLALEKLQFWRESSVSSSYEVWNVDRKKEFDVMCRGLRDSSHVYELEAIDPSNPNTHISNPIVSLSVPHTVQGEEFAS